MKTVKHISLILLITVIAYGVADLKSIAWCCGSCGQMSMQTESAEGCCHDQQSKEKSANHCEDIPCQVTSFEYDWDVSAISHVLKSVVFTIFALITEISAHNIASQVMNLSMVGNNSPPGKLLPREYLSFIRVLLI